MLTEYDIFISYSHSDVDWVKAWLLPQLESHGLSVCVDYRDFDIGLPSLDNMANAAVRSRKTLFVMTPNWTISEFSQFESLVTQTINPIGRKGRLLPLMLKDCNLPARLQLLTYADFKDKSNWETELKRVVSSIKTGAVAEAVTGREPKFQPNLVHPYPLQANFTGRVKEREELTAWLGDDQHPICELIAMGGMGKSALTWYWLTRDVVSSSDNNLEGVIWWSFQDVESSFAKFVDEALKYVSGRAIDVERLPTTYDRAQELRQQLQTKRVLFVLDGFEWQLRAYGRLDAAYQQDETEPSSREARACVDPNASRLLPYLAAGPTRAKVLITTRLPASELEDTAGDPLAGVLNQELTGLSDSDAVEFMRQQGVKNGRDAEISAVCAVYENHPLSLRLLSGLIEHDAKTPGDIVAAPRVASRANFVAAQRQILEKSYDAVLKKERDLLSGMAAFRNPMAYEALAIFNDFGDDENFQSALEDLQARGLLHRNKRRDRYHLHPIVRRYAYDRLTDKISTHIRLRDYFANISVPDKDKLKSIDDLASVIELYHHTVRAEHYDEAVILYRDLLSDLLFYRFGNYSICIELLRALFPDGEDERPRLKNESWQAWTLGTLAVSYGTSGWARQAVPLFKQQAAIREKQTDKRNLATALENLALQQLGLGELSTAEFNFRRDISLGEEIGNEFCQAAGHQALGLLLAYRGLSDEADEELLQGMRLHGDTLSGQWWQGTSWLYKALSALMRRDIPQAIESAKRARALKDIEFPGVGKVERDLILGEWLLGAALLMEGKDLGGAADHLTDALTRCRRINMVDHEPDILLSWARWHYAKGNAQEAAAYADQALAIADRCEYRLKQADIHNFLARLALDKNDRDTARGEATIARERAWCDGPPYCYKSALDEAEQMLKELGAEA